MNHHDFGLFLMQVSVMLVVALICGQIARRLWKLPVLGELVGGILLGPTVLGVLAPGLFQGLFPSAGAAAVGREALVKISLLFFLLTAGLEADFGLLRKHGRSWLFVSVLGIAIPFGLGYLAAVTLPDLFKDGAGGQGAGMALFIGTALSISALPVIARILMDMGLMRDRVGAVVLGSAMLDDIVGWFLFGLILSKWGVASGGGASAGGMSSLVGMAVLFVGALTVGRWGGRRLVEWLRVKMPWPSGFLGISAVLVFVVGALVEGLGSHAAMGAFLVGVALSPGFEERDQDRQTVTQFVTGLFAGPIYFVSVGLRADFVRGFDWLLVLVVLVAACVGKIGGAWLGARLGGVKNREALAIGFGMNARGVMEIVLASVAMENGLIGERVFVALVIMALVTSMLSGSLMRWALAKRPVA
ncbi:MAG: cation/H(+) antiporter [Verrucomicrobia bacterium]|nr:cation/H(+) antiporter [Verrucomicrobiota bacterium]